MVDVVQGMSTGRRGSVAEDWTGASQLRSVEPKLAALVGPAKGELAVARVNRIGRSVGARELVKLAVTSYSVGRPNLAGGRRR